MLNSVSKGKVKALCSGSCQPNWLGTFRYLILLDCRAFSDTLSVPFSFQEHQVKTKEIQLIFVVILFSQPGEIVKPRAKKNKNKTMTGALVTKLLV